MYVGWIGVSRQKCLLFENMGRFFLWLESRSFVRLPPYQITLYPIDRCRTNFSPEDYKGCF